MSYDSTADTLRHIMQVRDLLGMEVLSLVLRSAVHDQSKLRSPEKEIFDLVSPKLASLEYGSEAYRESLQEMGPALQHHYQANSHHPEHFPGGVAGMDLLDVLEMVVDWKAAAERGKGDGLVDLDHNVGRFGIEPQLEAILRNTLVNRGWLK